MGETRVAGAERDKEVRGRAGQGTGKGKVLIRFFTQIQRRALKAVALPCVRCYLPGADLPQLRLYVIWLIRLNIVHPENEDSDRLLWFPVRHYSGVYGLARSGSSTTLF